MAGCVSPGAFPIRGKDDRWINSTNRQQEKHPMALNHHRISSLELFRRTCSFGTVCTSRHRVGWPRAWSPRLDWLCVSSGREQQCEAKARAHQMKNVCSVPDREQQQQRRPTALASRLGLLPADRRWCVSMCVGCNSDRWEAVRCKDLEPSPPQHFLRLSTTRPKVGLMRAIDQTLSATPAQHTPHTHKHDKLSRTRNRSLL